MFDNLQERLGQAFQTLKGQGQISEVNVAQTSKEIRRALIDADVNYKTAKGVTDNIKKKALGEEVLTALKPGQVFTKIVYDELVELMGGEAAEISLEGDPAPLMIVGLQGSGKTTFSGKLAQFLKKQGRQVLLAACDVHRPAAIDQLHVVGEQAGVEVYSEKENKNAVEIAQNALQYAKNQGYKNVIVDTAGRLAIDEEMMQEVHAVKKALNPSETLFVVDAMTGQDAVQTAKTFNERLAYDGVVLSKLDGDTRGGAALSIRTEVAKPIKFISTGEKMDAIDRFYPDRMANRILGMGDVVSLVERAQQAFDEKEAERLNAKIKKNQFDFDDFLSQLQQIKKMGSIKDLVGMIPGISKMMKDVEIDDDAFKPVEAIIRSMTLEERNKPEIIDQSRKKRIARGSGTEVQDVNNLLKQFSEMRKMMKQMNKAEGGGAAVPGMQGKPIGKGKKKKKKRK